MPVLEIQRHRVLHFTLEDSFIRDAVIAALNNGPYRADLSRELRRSDLDESLFPNDVQFTVSMGDFDEQ